MRISPENPHFLKLRKLLREEALSPKEDLINARRAKIFGMRPSEYRELVEDFPFFDSREQVEYILRLTSGLKQ